MSRGHSFPFFKTNWADQKLFAEPDFLRKAYLQIDPTTCEHNSSQTAAYCFSMVPAPVHSTKQ
jgi:hypothetical protein